MTLTANGKYTTGKAATQGKVTPLHAAKDEALFRFICRVKDGEISLDELGQARLKQEDYNLLEGLHYGRSEQGLEGFKKVYQTLMIDHDVLKRLYNRVFDIPQFAGTLVSEVKAEKIDWLWKPRLALGKMTVFDGDPGLGKSLLLLDLIACITTGRAMPDGTRGIKGGAVIIMPEDGIADTIRPRLERAGADLTKVSSLGTIKDTTEDGREYERGLTLSDYDLRLLELEIKRVDAKIVVIDPIMALLGGKDTYKDNEVRVTLAPLKTLVEKHHVSCIMVRHLIKTRGDNPLMAGGGSVAFIGLARTGLMVVPDKFNGCNVFAHHKSNIGKTGESLTYTIASDDENGDDRPYIVWGDTTDTDVRDLINPIAPDKNTGNNRQQILDFLEEKKPAEVTVQEIAEAVPDMSMTNLKVTLKRMYDKGEIEKTVRGLYHAK